MPTIDELIADIHGCSLAPENWKQVVGQLASYFKADKALLLTPGSSCARLPPVMFGITEGALDPYYRFYCAQDPWVVGATERGIYRTGNIVVDDDVYDRKSYKASMYFNDFARTIDLDRGVAVCVIDDRDSLRTPPTALSLYRGAGDEAFTQSDKDVLHCLAPHLTIAIRNYWRYLSLQREMSVVRGALDDVNAAVYVVARSGDLIFANKTGEQELSAATWLELHSSRICASHRVLECQALEVALVRLRRGQGFSLQLQSQNAAHHAVICGAPYHPSCGSMSGQAASALIWLIPMQLDRRPVSLVAELFCLTTAEELLLQRLAAGDELKAAARVLGIAENTVRRQLKSVFAKTGRRRQSELLALLNRVATLRFSL